MFDTLDESFKDCSSTDGTLLKDRTYRLEDLIVDKEFIYTVQQPPEAIIDLC